MARFLNPYNFVRMLAQPPAPSDPEAALLWRCTPPPHDRHTGLSGRISCRLMTRTPLFVSDSVVADEQNEHRTYRFFNVNGERMIPGTSVRGPIRAIFEAATNSTFGVFDERENRLFYRMVPESALGLVPAIAEQDGQGEFRLRLLPGFLKVEPDSKNLYAAWIPQYPNEEILQKPDPRKHKHYVNKVPIPKDCQDGVCWAAVRKTTVRDAGFPHHQADFFAKERQTVEAWINRNRNFDYTTVEGYLYLTGLNIDRKQYERFFFSQSGKAPVYAALEQDVIDAYDSLMRDYHDRQQEIANSLTSQSESSRPLKPSRFITTKRPKTFDEGVLVYARIKSAPNGYQAVALYPVNVPRTAFKTSAGDLLYASHHHLMPGTDINELCPASRLFGWVSQEADENNLEKAVSYKGRLQFSEAINTKFINAGKTTLPILGTPHPTSTEFYLQGAEVKQKPNRPFGYDTPGARLRGRKFYRQHHTDVFIKPTRVQADKMNRTLEDPADVGSEFTFHIDFQNLQPVELGALLWTLELHNDVSGKSGYHRMGYGKPLGFGSVQITVTDLSLIDLRARYGSPDGLFTDTSISVTERIPGYKERFKQAFLRLYHPVEPGAACFEGLSNIADLFALLSEPEGSQAKIPIQYPQIPGKEEGFKWFMENRNADHPQRLGPAVNDPGLT